MDEVQHFQGMSETSRAVRRWYVRVQAQEYTKRERTKALVAQMATGRQEGRGKWSATSNMVELQLTVWLENRSRGITMQVPDRITSENLLEQAWTQK
jgi:hypothetical protein